MELEIEDTSLTKRKDGWYELNIIFNNDFEITQYIKPSLERLNYDPNTSPIIGHTISGSTYTSTE